MKTLLMAMAFGQMDYALHLLSYEAAKEVLSSSVAFEINKAILKDSKGFHLEQRKFTSRLYTVAELMVGLLRPMYNKWATADPSLGALPRSRKIFQY